MNRFCLCAVTALFGCATLAYGQDKVFYRENGGRGAVQTATGQIEAESAAGVRISGRTMASSDIVDIQYEVPPLIRLDYPKALAAENRSPAEAIQEYESLLKSPSLLNSRFIRRHFEYKIAALTAARAESGAAPLKDAIDLLTRFRTDNPDCWQLVPLTRILARLQLQKDPPDTDGARRTFDALANLPGLPPEVKAETSFRAIDLLLEAGQAADAQARLSKLPADDPRAQIYRIGCSVTADTLPTAIAQLKSIIEKTADPSLKATAYNMLGDCYRQNPKTKKDALFAYLHVDVVYNQDPAEVHKAVGRLAKLFAELKDDERARKYRERWKKSDY